MSSPAVQQETRVADIKGLRATEAMALAAAQQGALIRELEALSPEDWEKPTDCERWAVRDIVAHVIGWAEALTSPRSFLDMSREARRLRKELDVKLDAQNEAQVVSRRDMTAEELLDALRNASDRFLKLRRGVAFVGRALPMYHPVIGTTTVGFLMGQIYTRDHFMHRIDIARATGRDLELGEDERRLVADIVRHWARNSKADVRLVLQGPAGGIFVAGSGTTATITGDAVEFCRLLAGRAEPGVMDVSGDEPAARHWLTTRVPF